MKINFRSRSVTPSSHPGTPPQHQQNDMLSGSNFSNSLANSLTSAQMKPEFATARTYSDQLRNFAAKYNALNEYVALLSIFSRDIYTLYVELCRNTCRLLATVDTQKGQCFHKLKIIFLNITKRTV